MSGPDILFDLKNSFYLGNWQQCLNEAQKVKPVSDEQKLERDIFMYRAYTAQKKYGLVVSEIRDSAPAPLRAVKLLAQYLSQSAATERTTIAETIDTSQFGDDPISSIIAATIYYYEENFDTALKMLHNSVDMECMALTLQIYLRLDRLDLARKEHKRMSEIDEYCTLAQLALAWLCLFNGGEKLQDAFFIYQEMREKFGPTAVLLNGQACCAIAQARYPEAESLIQETIDRDSNYSEAIINQMVLAQFAGKSSETVNRYLNQLKAEAEDSPCGGCHVFARDFAAKEREFDRIALQYSS